MVASGVVILLSIGWNSSMFDIFLSIIAPIFLIILLGGAYRAIKPVKIEAINQVNMDVFTPALIISALAKPFPSDMAFGPFLIAAAVIVLLPGLLTLPILKPLGWNLKTIVPPMMFRNSGNLGIPLLVFAFGPDILPIAIMLFLVENTLHFTLGMALIQGRINPLSLLKMPMIQATIIGLSLAYFQVDLPMWAMRFLELTGQVAIPLMLFTLGIRMLDIDLSAWRFGFIGAGWTLVTGIVAFLPIYFFFDLSDQQLNILLLFALLPPAVLNYLVAERFNIEPTKVATLVLFTNALCVLWMLPALSWVLAP
jgi:predicted permease